MYPLFLLLLRWELFGSLSLNSYKYTVHCEPCLIFVYVPAIADTLIHGGANINYQDKEGNSGLHLCVRHACEEVMDYLINKGADATLVSTLIT